MNKKALFAGTIVLLLAFAILPAVSGVAYTPYYTVGHKYAKKLCPDYNKYPLYYKEGGSCDQIDTYLKSLPVSNLTAAELTYLGFDAENYSIPNSMTKKARYYYLLAIKKDPNYAPVYWAAGLPLLFIEHNPDGILLDYPGEPVKNATFSNAWANDMGPGASFFNRVYNSGEYKHLNSIADLKRIGFFKVWKEIGPPANVLIQMRLDPKPPTTTTTVHKDLTKAVDNGAWDAYNIYRVHPDIVVVLIGIFGLLSMVATIRHFRD